MSLESLFSILSFIVTYIKIPTVGYVKVFLSFFTYTICIYLFIKHNMKNVARSEQNLKDIHDNADLGYVYINSFTILDLKMKY